MKFYRSTDALIVTMSLAVLACGQEEVTLPELNTGATAGTCGAWYPSGNVTDAGAENGFGIEKDEVFPCLVWESARLDAEDTYINIGEEYLKAKHGATENRSIVIVVSAASCASCATLIEAMENRADEFALAGAILIGMARRDLQGAAEDPDFSLSKAEAVLKSEKWQTDKWYVINDAEHYLNSSFNEGTPWIIVVEMQNMIVRSVSNEEFSPDENGVDDLLGLLQVL